LATHLQAAAIAASLKYFPGPGFFLGVAIARLEKIFSHTAAESFSRSRETILAATGGPEVPNKKLKIP